MRGVERNGVLEKLCRVAELTVVQDKHPEVIVGSRQPGLQPQRFQKFLSAFLLLASVDQNHPEIEMGRRNIRPSRENCTQMLLGLAHLPGLYIKQGYPVMDLNIVRHELRGPMVQISRE